MKKKLFVVVLIALIVSMGFLRDYIFVSLNRFIEAGSDVDGKLFLLKWVLTFIFSLLYLGITCVFLYILFQTQQYTRIAVFSYALLFAAALSSASAGYFFSSFEAVYPFVRQILGVAQSPIVMMILVPFCLLNESLSHS